MDLAQLLFSFEGRIGRGPFWLGTVFVWVCYGLAFTTFNGLGGFSVGFFHPLTAEGPQNMFLESTAFAVLLFVVAMIVWIDLALQIKRWHDRTRSARWVLVCLFPGFGLLWSLIECGLFPGAAGPNRFGKAENTARRSALLA